MKLSSDKLLARDDPVEATVQSDDVAKYVGATLAEATRLAGEGGCVLRDMTRSDAWYTSDQRPNRINVWLNSDDRVERASQG